MNALMKFLFRCVLVCAITITAIAPLHADDPDSYNENGKDAKGNPVLSVDKDKLTREDVAQFLKEMKKLNKHHSSTPPPQNTTASQSQETSVEAISKLFDAMVPLIIGAASAGLLVILVTIVVIFVCCSKRKNAKKDLTLNKELNRWDPQLLRPSKEHIDAFFFGPPIPSVSEMIKQGV